MDKKDIFLALIVVLLLGIVGKMDYHDAVAESNLTHRSEVTGGTNGGKTYVD
jgi:hypothetical protein